MQTFNSSQKTIAFLATGSELLNGDVQDSDAHWASKIIYDAGGDVRLKVCVGDKIEDITTQLNYLLLEYDAIIIIGGLGPTSDDNTRYALSKATQLPLVLHKASLEHIEERLKKLGLKLTEANQKQALFPEDALIWINDLGTANACHLQWEGHDIFMLPGPPREYQPLFQNQVFPYLKKANYFKTKKMYRYLTLGFLEGQISPLVDKIAEKYNLTSAYRWNYPYLEIKLHGDSKGSSLEIKEIEDLLKNHIISTNGADAEEILGHSLKDLESPISIKLAPEALAILNKFNHSKIIFTTSNLKENSNIWAVEFKIQWPFEDEIKKIVHFNFFGLRENRVVFQHELGTLALDKHLDNFIQSYFAWQLSLFINFITKG